MLWIKLVCRKPLNEWVLNVRTKEAQRQNSNKQIRHTCTYAHTHACMSWVRIWPGVCDSHWRKSKDFTVDTTQKQVWVKYNVRQNRVMGSILGCLPFSSRKAYRVCNRTVCVWRKSPLTWSIPRIHKISIEMIQDSFDNWKRPFGNAELR